MDWSAEVCRARRILTGKGVYVYVWESVEEGDDTYDAASEGLCF